MPLYMTLLTKFIGLVYQYPYENHNYGNGLATNTSKLIIGKFIYTPLVEVPFALLCETKASQKVEKTEESLH